MFGLYKIGKNEEQALWMLVNCVKENLWDIDNTVGGETECQGMCIHVSMDPEGLYVYEYCYCKIYE